MRWLVWKEYGQHRLILIVGLVLLVAPHLVAVVVSWYQGGLPSAHRPPYYLASAAYSLAFSQLTLALLGGNAIASERADRSAEFVAYLPVSRARILAGKIMLALGTVAVIWSLNLLIVQFAYPYVWQSGAGSAEFARRVSVGTALTGFVFFSVGWLLSSRLESPTLSICGGFVTPVFIVLGIQAAAWACDCPFHELVWPWYQRICAVVAPVCFLAGSWYYVRRVEP